MLVINFAYKSGTNGYWNIDGVDKIIKTVKCKDYNYPIPPVKSMITLHINNGFKKYYVNEVNYIYGDDNDQDYKNIYIYVYLIKLND